MMMMMMMMKMIMMMTSFYEHNIFRNYASRLKLS